MPPFDPTDLLGSLADLASSSSNAYSPGLSGSSSRDITLSIENNCKNALDDEIAGAISLLFERKRGLPALLLTSLDNASRNEKHQQELRSDVLRLIDWLILDHTGRERQAHMAEYVCDIAGACLKVFFKEVSSVVRDHSISTLLAALELKEFVPNQAELRLLLFPPRDQCDPLRSPSAVQLYWSHLTSPKSAKGATETSRGACMRLLGRLAFLFPVSVSDEPVYEKKMLFRHCEASLRRQGCGQPEVTGALEGLDGLLLDSDELAAKEIADVFGFVKARLGLQMDGNDADLKRFGAPKAALGLLGRHLPLFAAEVGTPLAKEVSAKAAKTAKAAAASNGVGEAASLAMRDEHLEGERLRASLLLRHGEELWRSLCALWDHRNTELSGLADEVMRLVCERIGSQLAQAARCGVGDAFAPLRAFFDRQIRKLVSEAARASADRDPMAIEKMATAVRLQGSFARAVATAASGTGTGGGELSLARHMDALCDYVGAYLSPAAERYYESLKAVHTHTRQLPPFLHAFADLFSALPAAPERALGVIAGLIQLLFTNIDRVFESASQRFSRQAARAIQAVLCALAPKGDALRNLLRKFVPHAALVTIDQTARAQAEAAHEGAGMSGGGGSVASSAGGAPALFDGYLNRRLWSFLCDAALETPSRLQRKQPMLTAAARHRRRNALRDASAPSPSAPSPSAPSPSAPSPLVDHGDFEGARRANGREATYADSDDLAVEGGGVEESGLAAEQSARSLVCSAIVGELLLSLCSMLRRLDLSAMAVSADADDESGEEGDADGAAGAAAAAAAGGAAAEGERLRVEETEEVSALSAWVEADDPSGGGSGAVAQSVDDLSLFLAISTFCDGLLTELDPPLLLSWGHVLVHELIALSGRYPHVSGFYRLIRVVTTVADSAGYFERLVSSKEMAWSSPTPGYVASPRGAASAEATILTDCGDASIALGSVGSGQSQNERSRCYAMLSSFLLALLQRSRRFQDELLASALELLLAAPLRFMRGKLVQMTGVIHLALSMGHAYQPLVSAALGALERLNLDSSTRRRLQPHLPTLLPCLHSYLNVTSEGHTGHAGRLRNERDARRNLSASSRNAVLSSARTRLKRSLEDQLQQRVVAFLGSVGGDALALVHGSRLAPPAEGRWEIAPRVKMNLPSADISERDLELHLDAILPRVVEVTRRARRARASSLSSAPVRSRTSLFLVTPS